MVMELGAVYGIQLTRNRAQELAVSVGRTLAGLGVVKGGVALIGTALSVNLPTLLLGRAVQGVAAGWLTRIAGSSFITYFQQDQDWGDGGIQDVVQHHFELNRRDRSLKSFWTQHCGGWSNLFSRRRRNGFRPSQGFGRRRTHRAAAIENSDQHQVDHADQHRQCPGDNGDPTASGGWLCRHQRSSSLVSLSRAPSRSINASDVWGLPSTTLMR